MNYSIRTATLADQAEIKVLIAESARGLSREECDKRQIELSIKTVSGVDAEFRSSYNRRNALFDRLSIRQKRY